MYVYDHLHITAILLLFEMATATVYTNHSHSSARYTLCIMVNGLKQSPRKGQSTLSGHRVSR